MDTAFLLWVAMSKVKTSLMTPKTKFVVIQVKLFFHRKAVWMYSSVIGMPEPAEWVLNIQGGPNPLVTVLLSSLNRPWHSVG